MLLFIQEKTSYYLGFVEYNYLKGKGAFYNSDWSVSFNDEFVKNKRNGFKRDYDVKGNGMYWNDLQKWGAVFRKLSRWKTVSDIYFLKKTFQEVSYEKGNIILQGNITQWFKKNHKKIIESQINQIKEERECLNYFQKTIS